MTSLTLEEAAAISHSIPRTSDDVIKALSPEERALMYEDARTFCEVDRLRKQLAAAKKAARAAERKWKSSPAYVRVKAAEDVDFQARAKAWDAARRAKATPPSTVAFTPSPLES
jgi:hypothetical protein